MKIFSVYDSKAEAYLQPFFMNSSGSAIRAFTELCNDATSMFGKHPADFTLFELGSFEDAKAKFEPVVTPISLGVGSEYINSNTQ